MNNIDDLQKQLIICQNQIQIHTDIIEENYEKVYTLNKQLDNIKTEIAKTLNSKYPNHILVTQSLKRNGIGYCFVGTIINPVTICHNSQIINNKGASFTLKDCGDIHDMYVYFDKPLTVNTVIYCSYKYNKNKIEIGDILRVM